MHLSESEIIFGFMGYLNRRQRRMVEAFREQRERREPWPWLDELLAHAKRNGSRMCDKWDGYDDGERYSITLTGRKLLPQKG